MSNITERKYSFEDFSNISTAGGPVWHSSKDLLYFISNKEEFYQIFQLNIQDTANPTKLTNMANRTTVPMISNSGLIYFLSDVGGDENWQLFELNPETKVINRLTDLMDRKHQLNFVTDKQIIFSANRDDKKKFDVYSYSFANKKIQLLLNSPLEGLLSAESMSDDENKLLLTEDISVNIEKFYIFDLISKHLELISITNEGWWGSGKFLDSTTVLCLTNKDREFHSLALLDIEKNSFSYLETENWETEYFAFDKNTKSLAWSKNVDGYSKLFIGTLENNKITGINELSLPEKSVISAGDLRSFLSPLAFNCDATKLAIALDSSTMNQNVWVVELQENSSKTFKNTSNIVSEVIDSSVFVSESLHKIKSFDGLEFSSYLVLPSKSNSKKYPCVIMIHGGPEGQMRPNFNPLVQFFVYNDYAVALPNVRGSTGYGKTFNTLDNIELRLNSVKDISALAKYLQNIHEIDTKKLIVYGGSYGGYMVLACVTEFPDLFSAGIDIVGISNFVTFLENTAEWRRKIREVEYGSLGKDRTFLEDVSPIHKANNIKCPLLIVHGKNDERVPLKETLQMHETLKNNNIPSEMLVFEDEGHGVVRTKNKKILYQKILEFLNKYVR